MFRSQEEPIIKCILWFYSYTSTYISGQKAELVVGLYARFLCSCAHSAARPSARATIGYPVYKSSVETLHTRYPIVARAFRLRPSACESKGILHTSRNPPDVTGRGIRITELHEVLWQVSSITQLSTRKRNISARVP